MSYEIPQPKDNETRERWEHTARSYRMSTGKWSKDAADFQGTFFGEVARKFLPDPVTSRNPLLTYSRQKATLYDEPPVVSLAEEEKTTADRMEIDPDNPPVIEPPDLATILTDELWPLRQECLLLTLTCNESLIRVDWDESRERCRYRVIPAHRVEAWSTPQDPTNPYKVRELRPRLIDGEKVWTWETWDLGPKRDKPSFKIEKQDKEGRLFDVTKAVMGDEFKPGSYPYSAANKMTKALGQDATMPYVIYHSRVSNSLFSPYINSELVNGTLVVATCWTWWLGGLRDGSYPQRVLFNGKVKTSGTTNVGGHKGVEYIEMSPLTILQISGDGASIDQYGASMDPQQTGAAIQSFEAGLAVHADLSTADVQESGTSGMSGYAISVSREALRKAQVRLIPSQRMGDQLLLATAAAISNQFSSTDHSTDPSDYLLAYADISKSLTEVTSDLARYEKLAAFDLMDPVDAMLEINPSWTRDQAVAKIIDVMATKAELAKVKRALEAVNKTQPPILPQHGSNSDEQTAEGDPATEQPDSDPAEANGNDDSERASDPDTGDDSAE